jgi:hypothetical protein
MIENKHKVPVKQWKKWPDDARIAFNELYEEMLGDQTLFMHPHSALQADDCWKTTCWNAAWMSADIAQRANKQKVK